MVLLTAAAVFIAASVQLVIYGPPDPPPPPGPYWADITADQTLVDVTELTPSEARQVSQLVQRFPFPAGRPFAPIPRDQVRVPLRFEQPESYAVLTEVGVKTLGVRGFGVYEGPMNLHFVLILEGAADVPHGAGFVLGTEAPAQTREPLTFREAEPETGLTEDQLATLARNIRAKAPRRYRPKLVRHGLTQADTAVVRARFPRGFDALVSVNVVVDELDRFSALFFVDADLAVKAWLVEPDQRMEHYPIRYVLDINGDGIDEAIVDVKYYEGSYRKLLHFPRGKPTLRPLTGDGA